MNAKNKEQRDKKKADVDCDFDGLCPVLAITLHVCILSDIFLPLCDVSSARPQFCFSFLFCPIAEVEAEGGKNCAFFFLRFFTCMHGNSTTVRAQTVLGHCLIKSQQSATKNKIRVVEK